MCSSDLRAIVILMVRINVPLLKEDSGNLITLTARSVFGVEDNHASGPKVIRQQHVYSKEE